MKKEQEKQPIGASPGPPSEEYVPFGPEWAKEMSKFPKDALIQRLRKSLMHCQQYDPNRKTNAKSFAEHEIDILLKLYPTDDNPPIIKDFIPEILALVDKFGKSGQSGGSAPFTASAISDVVKKLCLFTSIAPITGEDSEWSNVSEYAPRDKIKSQNKRCGAIFKQADGVCTYVDAIRWIAGNNGYCGGARLPDGSIVRSMAIIKSFPFTPRTFNIKIREEEVEQDDFVFHIDNPAILDKVREYYDLIIYNE